MWLNILISDAWQWEQKILDVLVLETLPIYKKNWHKVEPWDHHSEVAQGLEN